jgi:hypothetical protein
MVASCFVSSCASKAQKLSFELKGRAIFKSPTEVDMPLSPEALRCMHGRLALLHQLGGTYQQVLVDVEDRKLSNQFKSAVLLCFHPRAATLPGFDQLGVMLFYHEAIHMLSSLGDLLRTQEHTAPPTGAPWSAFHEPCYRYYIAEEAPSYLCIPYVPGTLPMHAIYEPLKTQPYLAQLERYFSTANDNNFYILLEEWNAYNAGLALAVAFLANGLDQCAPNKTAEIANAAMEFVFYTARYLEALHSQQADLFHTLLEDEALRTFLRFQHTKTQRLIAEGQQYPCLFNVLTPQLQPVFHDASRRLSGLIGEQ